MSEMDKSGDPASLSNNTKSDVAEVSLEEPLSASGRPIRNRVKKDFDYVSISSLQQSSLNSTASATTSRKSLRQRVTISSNNVPKAKSILTKGKSRRIIFKRKPVKSTPSYSSVIPESKVCHSGVMYSIGDIVALKDVEGGTYYAQIRGLLSDQFGEKSCVLTWLVPTIEYQLGKFDPRHFILGPEEDMPRYLDACSFVCHCPSDYYRPLASPYFVSSKDCSKIGFVKNDNLDCVEEVDVCVIPTDPDSLFGPDKSLLETT